MAETIYLDSATDSRLEKLAKSSERIADALEELVQLQKAEYVTLKNKLDNRQEVTDNGREE